MRLFDRVVRLVVRDTTTGEETLIEGLQVEFTVTRTLELEPNTLECVVYNLSENTRKKLEEKHPHTVIVEAGYGVDLHVIFKGRVRTVRSRRDGANIATDIEAGDGKGLDRIWARKGFKKGASLDTVFNYLIKLIGVGPGNLQTALDQVENNGLPRELKQGMRVRGYGLDQLETLCNSRGMEFSVQNEECQFLVFGEGIEGIPRPKISSSSGLSGTPTVDNEGVLSADIRLTPNVFPGTLIDLESQFVEGTFRVVDATYTGSVWGDDFSISLEAKEIK